MLGQCSARTKPSADLVPAGYANASNDAGLRGRATVEILAAHVERTRDEVAPAVGEVGVVDLLHAVEADGAVGTRGRRRS